MRAPADAARGPKHMRRTQNNTDRILDLICSRLFVEGSHPS